MRGDKDYRFRQFKNFLMEILFLVFSAVTAFAMDHQDCKSSPSFRYKSEQANLKLKILVDAYVKLSGMPKDASSEFMRSQFYKSLRKFYLEFDEHSFTALSNYLNSALNSPKLNQTKETTKRKKKSEFYDTLVTELSENDIYVMKVPNTNLVFRLLNETDSKSVLFDANHNTGIEIELTKMQYSSKAIKLGTAVFVYSEEANKAYLIYKNNGKYKKLERNLDRDFKLISQSESSLLIVTRDGSLLKFLRDKDSSWSIYKRDLDLSGTNYIGDQKAIEMGPGAGLLYYRESGEPTQLKTVVYNISADRFQLEKTFIDEVNEPLGKHLFMGKGKIQKLIHENEKNFGVRQNILFEDTQNGWLKHEIPHDKGPQKINFSLGLDKNNLLVYGNRRDLYHYQKTATGFELLDKKQMYIVSIDKITDEIYGVKDQYGAEYLLSLKNGEINFEKHEGKPFLFGFQQVSPSIVITGRQGESFRILKIKEDKSIEELVDEDNPYGGNVFSARVLYDRWFLMFRSDGSAAYYVDLQEREKGLQVLKEEVHLFEPLEGGDDKYFVAIGKKQADSTLFRFTSDGIYKYPFDENNFDDGQSRRYSFLVTPEGVEFKGKYILRRNDQLFDREFE